MKAWHHFMQLQMVEIQEVSWILTVINFCQKVNKFKWKFFVDYEKTIERLIKKGANVDVKDNTGRTPYDIAKMRGKSIVVCYLQKDLNTLHSWNLKNLTNRWPLSGYNNIADILAHSKNTEIAEWWEPPLSDENLHLKIRTIYAFENK